MTHDEVWGTSYSEDKSYVSGMAEEGANGRVASETIGNACGGEGVGG